MPGPGKKQKAPKKKNPVIPAPESSVSPLEPLVLKPDDSELEPWVKSLLEKLDPVDLRNLTQEIYNTGYKLGYDSGCKNGNTYEAGYEIGFDDGIMEANARALRFLSNKKVQSEPQVEIEENKRVNTHTGTQTDAPAVTRTQEASLQVNPATRDATLQANPATGTAASQTSPATCNATPQTTPITCDATSQTLPTPHATTVGLPQPATAPTREPGSAKTGETPPQTEPHPREAASQTNEVPLPLPPRPRSAPPSSRIGQAGNGKPAPKTPDAQPSLPAPQPQTPPTAFDMTSQPTAPACKSEPPCPAPTCETLPRTELNMSPRASMALLSPLSNLDSPESHTNWADDVELTLKIPDAPRPTSAITRDLSALCPNHETTWTLRQRRMRRPRPRIGRTRRGLAQPTPPALFEVMNPALGPIFTRKHPAGIACGKPVVITAFGAPTPLPPHLTPPPSAPLPLHPAPPSPVPPPPHLMPPPSAPPLPRPAPPSPSPLLPHLTTPLSAPSPPRLIPPSLASLPPPCSAPSHSSGLDWESDPRLVDLSNALRALGWIRPPNDLPQG